MSILKSLLGGINFLTGRTKITVSTTVSRAISDEMLPDSKMKGMLNALMKDESVVDNILENSVQSIGLRTERMHRYAQNDYAYGLPSGSFFSASAGNDELESVLIGLDGPTAHLEYFKVCPANSLHIGWMEIVSRYNYNQATNELPGLSAIKLSPVYLVDMVVHVPATLWETLDKTVVEQWGDSPKSGYTPKRPLFQATNSISNYTPFVVDPAITEDFIKVTYAWVTTSTAGGITTKTHHEESVNIPLTDYVSTSAYYHVKYSVGSVIKYWMYEVGSGVHPTLDDALTPDQNTAGTFFPIFHFRDKGVSLLTNSLSDEYKSSVRAARVLGLDFGTIAEEIDKNPDISQVEQAMMMFAVPANTDNEIEINYLFDFFENVYYANGITTTHETVNGILEKLLKNPIKGLQSIVIEDKLFRMTLQYDDIFKRNKAGSIGAIGKCTSDVLSLLAPITYTDPLGTVITENLPATKHIYRKQITDTVYTELVITNLKMTYFIYNGYNVTAGENEDILLIPIDYSITEDYDLSTKETLYARSLHYVFNSKNILHIKWYQTGVFKIFVIIVAIVITILSKGATWQALVAAIAAGEVVTVLLIILEIVLTQIAVNLVFKLFVKVFGIKLAFLVAIIAAIAGVVNVIDSGSLANAPWATELLQISSGLSAAGSKKIQEGIEDLLKDFNDLSNYMKEQTKLLDDANDLLNQNVKLDPFIILGEKPNDFYNRTVHSGNVGILGIDAISMYVDSSLRLPQISDSISQE